MGAANILRVVLRQARAIGSFSRAGSFGMRVQFGRWTHVSPARTLGTRAGRGACSRLFSRYSSPGLKCIISSGWIAAWAAANEPGNVG